MNYQKIITFFFAIILISSATTSSGIIGFGIEDAYGLTQINSEKTLQYLDPKILVQESNKTLNQSNQQSFPEWAHNPIHAKRHLKSSEIGSLSLSPQVLVLSPQQVWNAYGLNSLNCSMTGYQWGDPHLCGYGQVIGIVDWYQDPNIESDLGTFSQAWGLPQCTFENGCLIVRVESGAAINPNVPGAATDLEISLDVEWVHAIAPGATILLVESDSSSFAALFGGSDPQGNHLGGVNYASQWLGVHQISMSFGGLETFNPNIYDSDFQKSGVSFFASTGDKGGNNVEYPATSPYVVSVGGTVLNLDGQGNFQSEIAWSGSGGGTSAYEPEPQYQSNYGISGTHRAIPDVSAVADFIPIYDSVQDKFGNQYGWIQVNGTSISAPIWASIMAIANSQHTVPLSSSSFGTLNSIYNAASGRFYSVNYRDIVSGNNGFCSICNTNLGYDFVTGIGSPITNNLISFLSTDFPLLPGPPVGLSANPFSSSAINLSWSVPLNNGGAPIAGYKIERESPIGGGFSTLVANTGTSSTTFLDQGLLPGTIYNYRISAINIIGTGPSSASASTKTFFANTVPNPPTGLTSVAISQSDINLTWSAPVNNGGPPITGYKIERESPIGGGFSVLVSNTASTITSYLDTGLLSSTTYNYRVSAINDVGPSSPSNSAAATSLPPNHSTITAISPNPSSVVFSNSITFHGRVVDTYTGTKTIPTGTLSWSDGGAGGIFSSNSCALIASSSSASTCPITYTAPSLTGLVKITGTYSGDSTHKTSHGNSTLIVTLHSTSTTVTPNPSSVAFGATITFQPKVSDTSSGTKTTPVGTITWSDGGAGGSFSGGNTCVLTPISSSSSTCPVKYNPPSLAGSVTIRGTYSGDTVHAKSSGTSPLTVTLRTTGMSVLPNPSAMVPDTKITFQARIADISTGTVSPPTGTVSWSDGGAGGNFTGGGTCTLVTVSSSASTCPITYTAPISTGTVTITGTYSGDSIHKASYGTSALIVTIINVFTNSSLYVTGNTILMYGKVNTILPDTPVTLLILDPKGSIVSVEQLAPDSSGNYNAERQAIGPLWMINGTYSVIAQYGMPSNQARTTFTFHTS